MTLVNVLNSNICNNVCSNICNIFATYATYIHKRNAYGATEAAVSQILTKLNIFK